MSREAASARIGSLFSGYGGLDLAAEAVFGGTTVWHSEPDRHASKVLALRWPGVPNLGDITAIDWHEAPPVDVLVGGFPCQDISSAGRGAGIKEGTRSGLWFRYADAVRVLRPRLVFVENVGALVVRGLDIVLGDLAALGYDAEWTCLRASAVGAPHRRERLFLLAWDADADAPVVARQGNGNAELRDRPPTTGGRGAPQPGRRSSPAADAGSPRAGRNARAVPRAAAADGWAGADVRAAVDAGTHAAPDADDAALDGERPRPQPGGRGQDAPDADGGRLEGGTQFDSQTPGDATDGRARGGHADRCRDEARWGPYASAITRWERTIGRPAPSPTDDRGRLNAPFAEWMMGLPDGWVTGPDVAALDVPRSAMLRMIGNGVVPQQGEAAGRILLARAATPWAVAA